VRDEIKEFSTDKGFKEAGEHLLNRIDQVVDNLDKATAGQWYDWIPGWGDYTVTSRNTHAIWDALYDIDEMSDHWDVLLKRKRKQRDQGGEPEKGTIYRVPSEGTPSKKPYIGRHKYPEPQKTRSSKDGRDRSQAEVVDEYDLDNPMEGRIKEERHIRKEGLDNLDNKRHEICPKKWRELNED
jgi:hypothetical protein